MPLTNSKSVLALAVVLVATGASGCATKKYVRQRIDERVAPVESRTGELEETSRRNRDRSRRPAAEPAVARLWHAPPIARWKLERGARALTDRSALSEVTFKTEEWLLSEVLADRGETVVVEPDAMRRAVAARARTLQSELGLSSRRKRTAERA